LKPEHLKEIVARADKFGVPRYLGMFKHALSAISDISLERIDAKLDFLKKLLGCSNNELGIAVRG
jgi:mTERF domain-containing protein